MTQAFEHFDENNDGQLSRGEFLEALRKMHLDDLTDREVDTIIDAMDMDRNGFVQYKEFARKL